MQIRLGRPAAFVAGLALCVGVGAAAFGSGASAPGVGASGNGRQPILLSEQGHFYVGADYQDTNPPTLVNQMYVQYQFPQVVKHPYPIILVHGGGGQGTDWMTTPDGRPGWATMLLAQGYKVYVVDRPAYGRSPNNVAYGPLGGSTSALQIQNSFSAPEKVNPLPWPQAALHTQWPGTGLIGDPVFTNFLASQNPGPTVASAVLKEDMGLLLDRTGPAIIMTHSAGVPSGWLAVDARPDLVRGVVAIEGATPSAQDAVYSPAGPATTVSVPSTELPNLSNCNLQAEPAKQLVNFTDLPVVAVASEASSQSRTIQCVAKYINQAGGSADLLRMQDVGVHGNGHMMMVEKNNEQVLAAIVDWVESNIERKTGDR